MRWLLLLCLTLFLGCDSSSSLDKLIPESAIAAANHENIEIVNLNLQEGKLVKGGRLVMADVLVSKNIKPEQIKPTALGILKTLSKKYNGCEWVALRLFDDTRMLDTSFFFAMAEIKEGNISITGGLPSDQDIADYNKMELNPDNIDFSKETRSVTLRRPTENDLNIVQQWYKTKLVMNRAPGYVPDGRIHSVVAKQLGLPKDKIKDSVSTAFIYYTFKLGEKIS